MKHTLLFVVLILAAFASKSQNLVFDIDQAGKAYKSATSNTFNAAEVTYQRATITLQDNTVVVTDTTTQQFNLALKDATTTISKAMYTRVWHGTDEKKLPMKFTLSVNMASKMATIEVAYKKLKSYYFGICTSGDLAIK